jgi:ferredoxin-NADP reductase
VSTTPHGTTSRATLRWQTAVVREARTETATARTLRLALPAARPHLAGQHYVVRLTAPDGYTASRSYSIASPPADGFDAPPAGEIELTVERLADGEVSGYLCDVAEPGDEFEVRGPIGGFFVWTGEKPALLVGGGSGVVPLMAMLRQARRTDRADLLRLVVSVRSPADLYYAEEIAGPQTTVVYTRTAAPGSARLAGRLAVADVAGLVRGGEDVFVCGTPGFADTATTALQEAGVPVGAIRVERFGPTT